jgi:hypothetical protein
MLLLTLVLGTVGNGTELVLLGHFEDWWQRIPLALTTLLLLVFLWMALTSGAAPVRALQGVLILCAASGGLGVLLHYRGNMEFELEMYPSMGGFELVRESMSGATPALAPGTMLVLALIGLTYSYRHPRLHATGILTSNEDSPR